MGEQDKKTYDLREAQTKIADISPTLNTITLKLKDCFKHSNHNVEFGRVDDKP